MTSAYRACSCAPVHAESSLRDLQGVRGTSIHAGVIGSAVEEIDVEARKMSWYDFKECAASSEGLRTV